jgi:hypothetical protein
MRALGLTIGAGSILVIASTAFAQGAWQCRARYSR